MAAKNVLMIFVKNPEPGKVKTRLAEAIGAVDAYKIYKKLMKYTMLEASQTTAEKQVWYSAFIDANDIFDHKVFSKEKQAGGDLGDKMKFAFQKAFNAGYKKVVIIGSDCPGITADIINGAFAQLNECGLVIGPSRDGGYYLLGMRELYPRLFDGISWSTSQVLDQTLERAKALNISFKTVQELNDIDTIEDLKSSGKSWLT